MPATVDVMPAGTRHKALVFLGFMLLALGLGALSCLSIRAGYATSRSNVVLDLPQNNFQLPWSAINAD